MLVCAHDVQTTHASYGSVSADVVAGMIARRSFWTAGCEEVAPASSLLWERVSLRCRERTLLKRILLATTMNCLYSMWRLA